MKTILKKKQENETDKIVANLTSDGSVGLFNNDVGDIYHDSKGALTESLDKFIDPSNLFEAAKNKKEIKLFDICFGLGYNSKLFLTKILKIADENHEILGKKIFPEGIYIETIDNDNIIYTLSAFMNLIPPVKSEGRKFATWNENFSKIDEKNFKLVSGYMKYEFFKQLHKIFPDENSNKKKNGKKDNKFIFKTNNFDKNSLKSVFKLILSNKSLKKFISPPDVLFMKFYIFSMVVYKGLPQLNLFLHNIYYSYLSKRYKNGLKNSNIGKVKVNYKKCDLREALRDDNCIYDLIYYDAFSPSKIPELWAKEIFVSFYKILRILNENGGGKLLTYSRAKFVKENMELAGFKVEKILKDGKNIGTISFNC